MFNYFNPVHFTTQCRILVSFFRPLSFLYIMRNSQHTGTEVPLLCVIFFNFIPARSPFRLQPLPQHFVLTWEFPALVTLARGMLIKTSRHPKMGWEGKEYPVVRWPDKDFQRLHVRAPRLFSTRWASSSGSSVHGKINDKKKEKETWEVGWENLSFLKSWI